MIEQPPKFERLMGRQLIPKQFKLQTKVYFYTQLFIIYYTDLI